MKTYTLTENQIRKAFRRRFHLCGEIWFPYGTRKWVDDLEKLGYSHRDATMMVERECDDTTERILREFLKELDKE
jgi:hypothetical protein